MMAGAMARRLLGGARTVAGVAAALGGHVAWYVSYRVGGTARGDERPRQAKRKH